MLPSKAELVVTGPLALVQGVRGSHTAYSASGRFSMALRTHGPGSTILLLPCVYLYGFEQMT